ncbi:aspartate--tRNA(Asn) ligase [Patescibacteria group bacterium]|nr:aspartate--tRNA(Asn) ligase [Patescibacteria group bacterium]MDE1946341.1 aspartate--tRNA(Asn) ligase [Patescibacteria group bacterium]MDE2010793.1 aspartate--tRNA(Asn) ligase [Patescibacteria group bacterium]MDE2233274.1 aspartate--tRNA(Asn) ligase [Patescibacteria group bacterium]
MRDRTYIKNLREKTGQEVSVFGWVDVRRDHGKLIFIDLRDVSGKVQSVALPNNKEAHEIANIVRPEWVVKATGIVNKRPEKMVSKNKETGEIEPNGEIEIELKNVEVLSRAKELPFELGTKINIDTHLDYLPLTLRDEKHSAIFKVQAQIVESFRKFFRDKGFVEFQAPKLIGDDAEGGANSFDVEYFGHTAHLAQSPQLYKQIMVGVFEKVFAIGNVYRAEKHSTTRHLNEYTSMDIEMGFIKDHKDIMTIENEFFSQLESDLRDNYAQEFKLLGAKIPSVPKEIPKMTLREAQAVITKETDKDCTNEPDLEPEHERWLCDYAQKQFGSDFIFITNFPTAKRPFYTYRDEKDPAYTKGFDLLFRGVEITTGAQRIHDYDALVSSMKDKGLNPDKFVYYLQAFKYGMPPHGGLGMGLERLTAKLLDIDNVKEATLFPRDINRIDTLLSK